MIVEGCFSHFYSLHFFFRCLFSFVCSNIAYLSEQEAYFRSVAWVIVFMLL